MMNLDVLISVLVLFIGYSSSQLNENEDVEIFGIKLYNVNLTNPFSPPLLTQSVEQTILIVPGENVELPCEALAIPDPFYSWTRDDVSLTTTNGSGLIQKKYSGTLNITDPQDYHEGYYQCTARNDHGIAISALAYLRKPILEPFPTVTDPVIHELVVGESFTLRCRAPLSYPPAVMYWALDDAAYERIATNERVTLDYQGNLHFAHILPEDGHGGRRYVCVAQNEPLRRLAQGDDQIINPFTPREIQLHHPMLVWAVPHRILALKGRELRLKCIFSGNPAPKVSWRRLANTMTSRMSERSHGHELVIDDVTFNDTGFYQCSATNSGKPVIYVIQVTVESPPFWDTDHNMEDKTVAEGMNVEFICSAGGIPAPDIAWLVNGQPISESLSNTSRFSIGRNFVRILNVQPTDSKVFQCNASNSHGYLFINSVLRVLAEPPQFVEKSREILFAAVKQTIQIKCEVFGAPRPSISWYKVYTELKNSTEERFKILESGNLWIRRVEMSDADNYMCTARNKYGNVTQIFKLIVRDSTNITKYTPSQTVNVPNSVVLNCSAVTDSNENLTVFWMKGDRVMSSNIDSRMRVEGGLVFIENVQISDNGSYTCKASNGIDSDQVTIELTVRDRPDPPMEVTLIHCNSSSAEISWKPGKENNVPVNIFFVTYNVTFGKNTEIGAYHEQGPRRSAHSSVATIPISPWGEYIFQVTAWNNLGPSRFSRPTQICATPPNKPFRNPKGVCTDLRDNQRLIITWQPMDWSEINGDGFSYMITHQRLRVKNSEAYKSVCSDWKCQEKGLMTSDTSFKKYHIYVEAFNLEGFALTNEFEQKIGYSGEDYPRVIPQNFDANVSGTTVNFFWDEVDEDPEEMRGVFVGYEIQFWEHIELPLEIIDNTTNITDFVVINSTEIIIEPTIVRIIVNNSTLVCSNTTVKPPKIPEKFFYQITKLQQNTSWVANIRVLTVNFSGNASEEIFFQTTEDPEETTTVFDLSTYSEYDENSTAVTTEIIIESTTRGRKPIRGSFFLDETSAQWFLILMFSIAFLLIILSIVCFAKRRRGQHYQVQEKEKVCGQGPEILEDSGFKEYVKRLTKTGGAGKRFRKRFDRERDSESGSLRDYDDHADMVRFLEDGSFIGQYCGLIKRSEPNLLASSASMV